MSEKQGIRGGPQRGMTRGNLKNLKIAEGGKGHRWLPGLLRDRVRVVTPAHQDRGTFIVFHQKAK
jgi:hypothetical protein